MRIKLLNEKKILKIKYNLILSINFILYRIYIVFKYIKLLCKKVIYLFDYYNFTLYFKYFT